jgi:hypothetical protein
MESHSDQYLPKVFISHQWRDKQLADRLARDLESFANVWMDYRDLQPGDAIQNTIDNVLKEIDLVLLIWSEHAQKSQGVQAEIHTCLDLKVRIVPCIFSYDEEGKPLPPLEGPLAQILGVDFHHYGSGLAQVALLLTQILNARLPQAAAAEVNEDPRTSMLQYLKGYLNYLANYRDIQGVDDQRSYWVDKIIGEIERFLANGGNKQQVRMLVEAAQRSNVDDPEGIGILVTRLKPLLGEAHSAQEPAMSIPEPSPGAQVQPSEWNQPPTPPADLLAQHVAQVVPAGEAEAWLSQVEGYLDSAPVALQALTAFAQGAGSPAGVQVVAYLQNYLDNADDLIPDRLGRYGLLDDAWLILNTAFRLVESGLVPLQVVPVDWQTIIAADHVVRAIIPPEVLTALTAALFQMLQLIGAEVGSYQPWFTPQGNGYAPTIAAPGASGGSWEDQMNDGLLGTGLSVYD